MKKEVYPVYTHLLLKSAASHRPATPDMLPNILLTVRQQMEVTAVNIRD